MNMSELISDKISLNSYANKPVLSMGYDCVG